MTVSEIIADFELHGYSVDLDGVVYHNGAAGCDCRSSRECDMLCNQLKAELLLWIDVERHTSKTYKDASQC